jgi:hypothetical protein
MSATNLAAWSSQLARKVRHLPQQAFSSSFSTSTTPSSWSVLVKVESNRSFLFVRDIEDPIEHRSPILIAVNEDVGGDLNQTAARLSVALRLKLRVHLIRGHAEQILHSFIN